MYSISKLILAAFFLILSLTTFAQEKASFNYYSVETLNKINATPTQKSKINEAVRNLKLQEYKNDLSLSVKERASKSTIARNELLAIFNQVISPKQKEIIKELVYEVQLENVKNGLSSFYDNDYFKKRMTLFQENPITTNAIVFLGNSITERGKWNELEPNKNIFNRGIGGDNTFGVLARLEEVIASKPSKIFLMIGVNDIGSRDWPLAIVYKNYSEIVERIKKGSPSTQLYIQSVLPINENITKNERFKEKLFFLKAFNEQLKVLAKKKNITYINLFDQLKDRIISLNQNLQLMAST